MLRKRCSATSVKTPTGRVQAKPAKEEEDKESRLHNWHAKAAAKDREAKEKG